MNGKNHIDNDRLEAYIIKTYIEGEIQEEKEVSDEYIMIEQHLGECDECSQKAHELLKEIKAISNWSVYEDNQVLLKLKVYEALISLEKATENPRVKKRLSKWVKDFKGQAGGTFKLMMEMVSAGRRKTTKMIIEGFEKLNTKSSILFDYGVELAPTRGGTNEIVVNFNQLKAENTATPLKINLDKKNRSLFIEFEAKKEKKLPMAVLLPVKASMSPVLQFPVYNEKQQKWEITFKDIGEGEYYFLFEPGYMV